MKIEDRSKIKTLATISINSNNEHITTVQHQDVKRESVILTPASQIRHERVSMLWTRESERLDDLREKDHFRMLARINKGKVKVYA